MTYGTSHLLIGEGGGIFRGWVKKKYRCVRGWGYNIGGEVFCQLNLISKKGPNAKMRKKCKKISNIEKKFPRPFAHSAFYKIHISGVANRHAPDQYAKYVVLFSFFSKQSS